MFEHGQNNNQIGLILYVTNMTQIGFSIKALFDGFLETLYQVCSVGVVWKIKQKHNRNTKYILIIFLINIFVSSKLLIVTTNLDINLSLRLVYYIKMIIIVDMCACDVVKHYQERHN